MTKEAGKPSAKLCKKALLSCFSLLFWNFSLHFGKKRYILIIGNQKRMKGENVLRHCSNVFSFLRISFSNKHMEDTI